MEPWNRPTWTFQLQTRDPVFSPLQRISAGFSRPFLKSTDSDCQVQASLPAQASRVTPYVLCEEHRLQAAPLS